MDNRLKTCLAYLLLRYILDNQVSISTRDRLLNIVMELLFDVSGYPQANIERMFASLAAANEDEIPF